MAMEPTRSLENFTCLNTTSGTLKNLSGYTQNGFLLITLTSRALTPVNATQIAALTGMQKALAAKDVHCLALHLDTMEALQQLKNDLNNSMNLTLNWPLASISTADATAILNSLSLAMPITREIDVTLLRETLTENQVVIIANSSLEIVYSQWQPAYIGFNTREIFRIIDALKIQQSHQELAVPANWEPGQDLLLTSEALTNPQHTYNLTAHYTNYLKLVQEPETPHAIEA